ncbi:MAG: hypothetical protein KQ78_02256 [Candidatus Izimaplasma bacterium HR2]|nr:MAG: hypothetical protein KQ78_02256 [Candidatus Izimaplasma bacterium HR2]
MSAIPPWNMSEIHTGIENIEQNGLSDGQLSRLGINVPIYDDEEQDIETSEDDSIHDVTDIGDLEVHGTTILNDLCVNRITTNEISVDDCDIKATIDELENKLCIFEERLRRIEENGENKS